MNFKIINKRINFLNRFRRFIKYSSVGAAASIIDYALSNIMVYSFRLNYICSNILSASFVIILSFYIHYYWTFQVVDGKKRIIFVKYLIFVLISFILNNLLMYIFVSIFNIPFYIAKVLEIGILFLFNYTGSRLFIFK